ncbi:MAG: hypothetical protein CVV27_03790 [Candidatus Melainabacteria bacterium HGW-Melainabacteria-1]|nr:MAG: hypothetical protein CVV27_03790 [Candidatus Melainabacteria bacterium HGW-Melainabacteria-1]
MEPGQVLFSPQNLKAARKRVKLTQEQVAEQLGVSIDTVRSWEQGRAEPPITRLREMGRLYAVSFIV